MNTHVGFSNYATDTSHTVIGHHAEPAHLKGTVAMMSSLDPPGPAGPQGPPGPRGPLLPNYSDQTYIKSLKNLLNNTITSEEINVILESRQNISENIFDMLLQRDKEYVLKKIKTLPLNHCLKYFDNEILNKYDFNNDVKFILDLRNNIVPTQEYENRDDVVEIVLKERLNYKIPDLIDEEIEENLNNENLNSENDYIQYLLDVQEIPLYELSLHFGRYKIHKFNDEFIYIDKNIYFFSTHKQMPEDWIQIDIGLYQKSRIPGEIVKYLQSSNLQKIAKNPYS